MGAKTVHQTPITSQFRANITTEPHFTDVIRTNELKKLSVSRLSIITIHSLSEKQLDQVH
jgi:hypothetical protein